MREVVAELERPVLLFLRRQGLDRAAATGRGRHSGVGGIRTLPFPVLHVDTGHNFPEVIDVPRSADRRLRTRTAGRLGPGSRSTRGACPRGRSPPPRAIKLQTRTAARRAGGRPLRRGLRRWPARRGAGPGQGARVLVPVTNSASGSRAPSAPSPGRSTTGRIRRGENIRVFPISNWTELDVWQYIAQERARAAVDLLRPRTRTGAPRRHAASPSPHVMHPSRRPKPVERDEASATAPSGDLTVTGAVPSAAAGRRRRDRGGACLGGLPSAGETRADDRTSGGGDGRLASARATSDGPPRI